MERYFPHIIRICDRWITTELDYDIAHGITSPHFEPGQLVIMKNGPKVIVALVELYGGYGSFANEVYRNSKMIYTVFYGGTRYLVKESDLSLP